MAEIRATPPMTLKRAVNGKRPIGAMPTGDCGIGLETNVGAAIGMTYRGMRRGPADAVVVGAFLDPAVYRFRAAVCHEAALPKNDWLNRIAAVGPVGPPPENSVHEIFPVHCIHEVL